jgi:hypothetical protein
MVNPNVEIVGITEFAKYVPLVILRILSNMVVQFTNE